MKYVYALKYFLRNVKRKIDSDYKLRKRLNRIKLVGTIVVVVVICVMLNYKKLSLQKEQVACEKRLAMIKEDYEEEEERIEDIKEYRAYVQTKQYAEEVAREKLGLVYPGEIIFEVEKN
ncbi:MAG: septum formation initiator [Lachnospiraceae bacterium]|nr:septum formation initiator [Lachnospiraceae bacterium]